MSRSLKMELIKEFEEGKIPEEQWARDAVNYTGMVICRVIHDCGTEKVFGFEPHAEKGKHFFLATLYRNKIKSPWFRQGAKRYLLEDFLKVGIAG